MQNSRLPKLVAIPLTAAITCGAIAFSPSIALADEAPVADAQQATDTVSVEAPAPVADPAPASEPEPISNPPLESTPTPVEEVVSAAPVTEQPVEVPSTPPVVNEPAAKVDAPEQQIAPESLNKPAVDTAMQIAATVDSTPPTVTIKPESIGKDGVYRNVSLKLYDAGKIDRIVINGVVKDLSNNVYSDLNGVKPGVYGAVQGLNTIEVYDVAGNVTIIVIPLDTAGPTFTVKPEGTTGADGIYQKLSVKLFDPSKVDKAIINGVEKDLTDNVWSDLNGITPGVFGAKEGLNTLVLVDALGNQSTYTFILDTTKPVINTPAGGQWVSGAHTWTITQDEANPAKAYVEIQQLVDGKWKKFQGFEIKNSNDLTVTFDTTKLASNVPTQIKISTWDKAGNHTSKTFGVNIDNVAPTITVKPESIGSDGVFSNVSFKLYDGLSGVDKVFVNGIEKDLTNNKWSDLNGLVPGKFGAIEGENLITLQDVAGNTASVKITLDVTAPSVIDVQHEWQTERNRESITVTFTEPVFNLPQGWYGSGTVWTKVFYNTKDHNLTFEDQAGNAGSATITPKGAPVVEQPTEPEEPTTPVDPTDPTEPTTPVDPETPTGPEQPGGPLNPNPSDPILPENPDGSDDSGIAPPKGSSPEDYSQGDDVTIGSQPINTTPLTGPVNTESVLVNYKVTQQQPTAAAPTSTTLAATGADNMARGFAAGLATLLAGIGAMIVARRKTAQRTSH